MAFDVILLTRDATADLPAGEFTAWLENMDRAMRGESDSDVPCGDCNACCRSSYFIELKPADSDARDRIPAALRFDAPGAPAGYQLLGYDERGRCPMLESGGCTIYPHRPATCRTYDCRIFAATGLAEPGPEKADVTARAARWQFEYADGESRGKHETLALGARLLLDMSRESESILPRTATQLAMLAIRLQPVFEDIRHGLPHAGRVARERILQAAGALSRR
jgi:Fe-S-cluster containining protein